MLDYLRRYITGAAYSFPVQLLLMHFRNTPVLLLFWAVMFFGTAGVFGRSYGVMHVLLDPEYLGEVTFFSFFWSGLAFSMFLMAWNVTTYVMNSHHFPFLASLNRPFSKYCLNNMLIPSAFIVFYMISIHTFQSYNQYAGAHKIWQLQAGFLFGTTLGLLIAALYFQLTNKDVFTYLQTADFLHLKADFDWLNRQITRSLDRNFKGISNLNKRINKNIDTSLRKVKMPLRLSAVADRRKQQEADRVRDNPYHEAWRVDYYWTLGFRIKRVRNVRHYNPELLLRVFRQNHFNAFVIQIASAFFLLLLGFLVEYPFFVLPALASALLLFAGLTSLAGALSYWLRGWYIVGVVALLLLMNWITGMPRFAEYNIVYGLNYDTIPAEWTYQNIDKLSSMQNYRTDVAATLRILERWRFKNTPRLAVNDTTAFANDTLTTAAALVTDLTPLKDNKTDTIPVKILVEKQNTRIKTRIKSRHKNTPALTTINAQKTPIKPKLVFVCASGGGMRAGLWAMTVLQTADSLTHGALTRHTILEAGASGGMLGLAYYRELAWQNARHKLPYSPYSAQYRHNIAKDLLNPVLFSLATNDFFVPWLKFNFSHTQHHLDRGYYFEQTLVKNTEGLLGRKLADYKLPEARAEMPMMMLTPAIIADGRRLLISPQGTSYMTQQSSAFRDSVLGDIDAIEFRRFFAAQNADNLQFTSALRMNATYPYILPNVHLPSLPTMEVMDAGMVDNSGLNSAARFMDVFRDWIAANTSGVVIVQILDSGLRDTPLIGKPEGVIARFINPLTTLGTLSLDVQNYHDNNMLNYLQESFGKGHIDVVRFVYKSKREQDRASLSFHLSRREYEDVVSAILHPDNQQNLARLQQLLR
jgi:hypothetical protein